METTKNYPRYIRIPQSLLDFSNRPIKTVADAILLAEDLGKPHALLLAEEEPKLLWGTGVYRVNPDDTLTLVKEDFDTSG